MEIETQDCYLCDATKPLKEFIKRKDGIYYRMCKDCNEEVQKKKLENPGKRLKHTDTHRTCYKCMRFLENTNFNFLFFNFPYRLIYNSSHRGQFADHR